MTAFEGTELRRMLRGRALGLGFAFCGVTTADPLTDACGHLEAWLAAGFEAGMAFLREAPAGRSDPRSFLPGARSVVMAGWPYARLVGRAVTTREGQVAGYAQGADYHVVVRERLGELIGWLHGVAGGAIATRVFVDAQALLERALARRAGLGFVGRNTCLIHPVLGSRFVLGGFATDLEIPADSPLDASVGCGDCRRCLDACPAGALVAPRMLDAGRCLSYLTIEHRGAWRDGVAGMVGGRLFGCDTCQAVCPFNAFPRIVGDFEGATLELGEVLSLRSNAAFERRFAGSALLRARRSGLLRNALAVAANLRRVDLIERVRELASAEEPSEVVRTAARAALVVLEQVGGQDGLF